MSEDIMRTQLKDEKEERADILKTLKHVSNACPETYGYLKDVIDWFERIGRWKCRYDGVYECTYCKAKLCVMEDEYGKPKYGYCPYCGTLMKGA